jgi:protoheme IX farnesyltransferase
LRAKVGAYVALTKPRIIELLLVTTVPTMFLAARGVPSIWLMVATVIGGTLAAGGANAVNMYVDRDIDAVMDRTKGRPLVTGAVTPRAALTFAIVIEAVAFVWLWAFANLISALLAVGATAFYVFIYTLWLKRSTSSNIVIGGAAGAAPVLIGWTAVTGHLAWAPWVLFAIMFVWTPPHFWALAVKYKDDYAAADVPMLPAVASERAVGIQIVGYSIVLVALTLVLAPVAHLGLIYTLAAIGLGAVFLGLAVGVLRTGSAKVSMRLFSYSITYVTVLFAVMAIDAVVH